MPTTAARPLHALFLLLALVLGGLMHARTAHCCSPATPVRQSATDHGAIDVGVAVDHFLRARAWLDADALPPVDSDAAKIDSTGSSAVCVILRLDGRFVGAGEDARGDATMLRRAVGEAVAKALGDETIRSVRAAAGDRITARLSLEVELAGPLSPLLGRTLADACARIVSGRDGLAVRRGDQVVRAFPSRMSLTDTADRPSGVITSLLVDAGLPAKDINEYDTRERVSLARFQTVRVRGDSPRAAPSIVERGGRTIEMQEIGKSAAASLAARLAARLAAEVVEIRAQAAATDAQTPVWLRGTFDPTHDRYDPALASEREAALALLALARARDSDALAPAVREVAKARAERLLLAIAARPDDARTAMVESICAIAACKASDRVRSLLAAQVALGDKRSVEDTLWLAAAADEQACADAVRAALNLPPERQSELVRAILPLALIASRGTLSVDLQDEIRSRLTRLADTLAPLQIGCDGLPLGTGPGSMPADLAGGLAPQGSARLDARSTALAPFAALAIAHVGAFQPMQRGALRFLAQHVADDPWVGGFRSPDALRGLVRDSLSGNNCPPDRLALGLLLALAASENG